MWFILLQLSGILAQDLDLRCGGDRSFEEEIPHHKRHLLTRSTSLAPIRILFYYYNFDLGTPDLNSYFYNEFMPAVNSFLTTSLKVYPIQGNLVLSSTNCLSNIVVPADHRTVGVSADMIIYVGVDNLSGVSYVAYAGSCERQSDGLNNVLAGTIIFNVPNFAGSSFVSSLAVITHEITHILGFSQNSMNYWKTSSGTAYATNTLTKTVSIRGATKTLIVTPNVVAKAKEAFGCSTLEGIELEEYGGSGTAGSHWDKRIMMNDYMTGYVPSEPIWSTITLALLQDSGWYTVDYTLAIPPLFGKFQGCNFFNNKCVSNGVAADSRVWCDTQASWTCDVFALNKGPCNIVTYSSSLPLEYQYYSTPTIGGSDSYADYCPYRQRYSNGSCRGNSQVTSTLSHSNEVISIKSRCFESNLDESPYSYSGSYSACYEVILCTASSATIRIGTQTLVCPFTGGIFTVQGYTGTIKCPASTILCEDVPCKNMCYGKGTCSKGYCQCLPGFSGDDCSMICGVGCKSCDSTGCLVCNTLYTLTNGVCSLCSSNCLACTSPTACTSCSNGYYIDNGSCKSCTQPCVTCSNSNTCTSCISGYTLNNGLCVLVCPNNCVTCSQTQCFSCNFGYYADTINSCAACPSVCLTCTSSSACNTCIAGYTLVNGACVMICSSNCNACSSSTVCTACNSGYYLLSNSCSQCVSPCATCTSASACSSCISGYQLSNGICSLICPSNCQACSSNTVCTTCNNGYYLSSGSCIQCVSPCSACTSSSTCTGCISNYQLVNNACVQVCPSNCQSCSSSTVCTTCITGYYLSSGNCSKCPSTCTSCTSSTSCQSCIAGYQVVNKSCVLICPSNCKSCSSNTICTTCNTGYYLSSGSCYQCTSPCSSCTSSTSCSACLTGYYLSSGTCLSCVSPCSACTSSTTCTKCITGFYLTSPTCTQCPSICTACTSSTKCTGCITGYVLSNSVCVQCPVNCLTCSSPTKCTACVGGYRLSNGSCIACSANCLTCTSSRCSQCMTGYTLSGSVCV